MTKFISLAMTAAVIALGAGIATANECPLLIKQLKENQDKVTDAKKKAELTKLIAQSEKLHSEGKHADSIKAADEAAKLEGITLTHKDAK